MKEPQDEGEKGVERVGIGEKVGHTPERNEDQERIAGVGYNFSGFRHGPNMRGLPSVASFAVALFNATNKLGAMFHRNFQ
jgi:hypothetical protein